MTDAALTVLESSSGTLQTLAVDRWCADASAADRALMAALNGPTLDVGCGPGRLVQVLAERGVTALGVDVSPAALHQATARGAAVLERSVFDRLPGEGRWANALLLDGNIGIGGDPGRLLNRIGELLAADGQAVIEVDPPGSGGIRCEAARLHRHGQRSDWFPWAWVGADGVLDLAARSGLEVVTTSEVASRWFTRLRKPLGTCQTQTQGRRSGDLGTNGTRVQRTGSVTRWTMP